MNIFIHVLEIAVLLLTCGAFLCLDYMKTMSRIETDRAIAAFANSYFKSLNNNQNFNLPPLDDLPK